MAIIESNLDYNAGYLDPKRVRLSSASELGTQLPSFSGCTFFKLLNGTSPSHNIRDFGGYDTSHPSTINMDLILSPLRLHFFNQQHNVRALQHVFFPSCLPPPSQNITI